MSKLPTLSKYILDLNKLWSDGKIDNYQFVCRSSNFTKFVVQPPILADFIATDKSGKPLEKPPYWDSYCHGEYPSPEIQELHREYQEAQSRVKWVGWSLGENGYLVNEFGNSLGLMENKDCFKKPIIPRFIFDTNCESYEQIITAGIPLEPNEQFGKELNINQ